VPHLAFCANCGSERLDIIAGGQRIQIRCYVCTKTSDVSGVILGEVDFLAGAQAKVDAMIAKAKERATGSLSESRNEATTQRSGTPQGSLRR
jgi:hypothetical protein